MSVSKETLLVVLGRRTSKRTHAIWQLIRRYRDYLDQTSSAALDYDPIWLRNIVVALTIGAILYAGLEIADVTVGLSYNAAFPFQVLIMSVITWFAIDATWRLLKPFMRQKTWMQLKNY